MVAVIYSRLALSADFARLTAPTGSTTSPRHNCALTPVIRSLGGMRDSMEESNQNASEAQTMKMERGEIPKYEQSVGLRKGLDPISLYRRHYTFLLRRLGCLSWVILVFWKNGELRRPGHVLRHWLSLWGQKRPGEYRQTFHSRNRGRSWLYDPTPGN